MDKSKVPPLATIQLKSRPLTSHALAWSCDAELAVATDDTIHILLPEYPKSQPAGSVPAAASSSAAATAAPAAAAAAAAPSHGADIDIPPQYSLSFRAAGLLRPDPAVNGQLCAAQGLQASGPRAGEENWFSGVGSGLVTGSGGAVCQVVRLEWSPPGLGCNLRPVLAALSTSGALFVMGEHVDRGSTIVAGMRTRGFKAWKMLWGLGALLPIPDAKAEGGLRIMDERIVAFSWAKEILTGRALLAYRNDAEEVCIMAVQLHSREKPSGTAGEQETIWSLSEAARFDARGPHTKEDSTDIMDPDYVPHGSAFSLKWSPWQLHNGKKTAILAYMGKNYVGFRRVTMQSDWAKGEQPQITPDEADVASICLYLSTDAFLEFESWVSPEISLGGGRPVVRGVICTPFEVKPFQVSFDDLGQPVSEPHHTWQCSTTYSKEDANASTNPITGLVIHPPTSTSSTSSVPRYSLTRLSAPATNQDWYQTNVPEAESHIPQWATKIRKQTSRLVPRLTALEGLDSDSDDDSDDEMAEAEGDKLQVHPFRYRIWSLAASPGGGSTAVLVSRYSTQHPERRGVSKVVFGWRGDDSGNDMDSQALETSQRGMTTEGRVWEWMYGGGPEAPGTTALDFYARVASLVYNTPLREQFKPIQASQVCVFCDAALRVEDDEVRCEEGHSFARCASTGLAIMAPDISHLCAVCGLRCLKVEELAAIATRHLGPETAVESSGEACGGCGGKFVA